MRKCGFMGQTGVDSGKHIKLYMVSPNAPDGKMLHSIRPGILLPGEISTMSHGGVRGQRARRQLCRQGDHGHGHGAAEAVARDEHGGPEGAVGESFLPSDVGNKLRLKYKDDTESGALWGATPTWTSVGRSTVKPEPSDSTRTEIVRRRRKKRKAAGDPILPEVASDAPPRM